MQYLCIYVCLLIITSQAAPVNPLKGEVTLDLEPTPEVKPPIKLPTKLSNNFVLLGVDVDGYVGVVDDDVMAKISHSFRFQVFQDEWTFVPLFGSGIISGGFVIRDSNGDVVGEEVAFITALSGEMTMVVKKAGKYSVDAVVYRPVQVSRNLYSFDMYEKYQIGGFSLNITGTQVRDLAISPLAAIETHSEDNSTFIKALTQRDTTWSVSWRDREPVNPDNHSKKTEENAVPQVTVIQETLHSVAEMTVQSTSNFTYELNSDIDIVKELKMKIYGKGVRIIRVAGIHMDKWSVEEQEDDSLMLHIMLKKAISNNRYQLLLVTEQNTAGEAKVFSVPTFLCLNVLRHQGQIGVVKAANVEIHEVKNSGVLTAEPSELSYSLRVRTSKSILIAYTFLAPDYQIVLQKERHEATNTLDSSIDHAHLKILVSEDYSLNKALFRITNSNKQYLRVTLPANTQAIWSVHVADEPVKPSKDSSGALLIPLTSIMSSGSTVEWHSVELVYLTAHNPLGKNGTFEADIFTVDVPITLLSVEFLFPTHLPVLVTSDALRQVHYFSQNIPTITRQLKGNNVVPSGYQKWNEPEIMNDFPEERYTNVKVEVPVVGSQHRFEKLLVLGQSFKITAVYPYPPPLVESHPFIAWVKDLLRL